MGAPLRADTPAKRFASQVVAIDMVRELATILGARGIPVMPLKGALLIADVFGVGGPRVVSDVDVLVPETLFERAIDALEAAGYESLVHNRGRSTETLRRPGGALTVDLHREPLVRGLFLLDGTALFARSHEDAALFGAPVRVPSPLDLYAHLVGHFAKGRLVAADAMHLADFAAVARRYALAPEACAAHLVACGMGRAARYVLALAYEIAGDRHAGEVLAALPPDPLGDRLAAYARAAFERGLPGEPVLALHVLSGSLPRGARSLATHVREGITERVWLWRRNRRLSRYPSPSSARR